MKKIKLTPAIFIAPLLFFITTGNYGNHSLLPEMQGLPDKPGIQQAVTKTKATSSNTQQATTRKKQVTSKTKPAGTKTSKSSPVKSQKSNAASVVEKGIVVIGTQKWAAANLNVGTFRNGDTIPEARTVEEWVAAGKAGKPAWCYYNNDTVAGKRYGKLYNWFAVSDPRGLAPEGWVIPSNEDWAKLAYFLGGSQVAGLKMKNQTGWNEGNNGTNESGFAGLPGGYRVENGTFVNAGKIGIWWSSVASHTSAAYDYYLFMSTGLGRSTNQASRGESVRCIKK